MTRIIPSGGIVGDNLGRFYGEVVFSIAAPGPCLSGLSLAGELPVFAENHASSRGARPYAWVMQPDDNLHTPRWQSSPRLLPALIIIAIGVLFLLGNLHVLDADDWFRYWPAILIAVGLVKLVDSNHSGGRVTGGALMAVGALLLVKSLGLYDFRMHDMWPLLLIGAGLLMLWNRAFTPWHGAPAGAGGNVTPGDTVNQYAIFGGSERRISGDFRGGSMSAMFGGCELDLRRAGMVGDSAVVEISVIFGGAEIKIPENWIAEVQAVPIFGGVDNKTAPPNPQTPGVKRLFIKGAVIFGGVEVKN